jgi:ABC transport system ATP-binding/permease protein
MYFVALGNAPSNCDRINLALAFLTAPIGISLIMVALQDKNPFVPAQPDPTLAP